MKKLKTIFYIQNPNGIAYHSPRLRYSATLGGHDATSSMVYPNGVTSAHTQPRWGRQVLGGSYTQGSGVPQPWAELRHPVGILNTSTRFRVSPLKDVRNGRSTTWKRACNLGVTKKETLRELSEEAIRLLNGYRSAILTPNSYLLTSELENK